MFLKISEKIVIDSNDVSKVLKLRVEGPLNSEGWFIVLKNGEKHRVVNHDIDDLVDLLNSKSI